MSDAKPPAVQYHHTQPGHTIRLGILASLAPLLVVMLVAPDVPESAWFPEAVYAVIVCSLLAAAVLFWSLTVEVTETDLVFRFGPGLVRKRIPLSEMADVEPTRTSFWNGWGIHWTRRGWLYNVSGFDAVLVRLVTGKSLLIGTDEPQALADAIHSGISRTAGEATDG